MRLLSVGIIHFMRTYWKAADVSEKSRIIIMVKQKDFISCICVARDVKKATIYKWKDSQINGK